MPDIPRILADLFAAADAAGMTQRDIARVCGVHHVTVNKWAKGRVSPGVKYLQPLADHLGIRLTKPRKR